MTSITGHLVKKLTWELRAYGLNPRDWRIQISPRGQGAKVHHRRDPSLRLRGRVARGQWHQLEFVGL